MNRERLIMQIRAQQGERETKVRPLDGLIWYNVYDEVVLRITSIFEVIIGL